MSRKNKEKEPEKKKSKIPSILIVLLLIIAILMIVGSLGFGGGYGSGNGDSNSNSGSSVSGTETGQIGNAETVTENESSETATVSEDTTETIIYIDVTVSGSTYIMDGNKTTLDTVIETTAGDNIVVKISDENAVVDTMENLISALDNNGISYIEPNKE